MELPFDNDSATHLLIDSDTNSKSITENDSDSYESSTCDIQIDQKNEHASVNILDKEFSIDESDLATPLEPIQAKTFPTLKLDELANDESVSDISRRYEDDCGYDDISITEQEEDFTEFTYTNQGYKSQKKKERLGLSLDGLITIPEQIQETEKRTNNLSLVQRTHSSILRKRRHEDEQIIGIANTKNRNVSFPAEAELLCTYREPEYPLRWSIREDMLAEQILQIYQESCKKHNTIELDTITSQILEIKNNRNHSATLKLHGLKITSEVNETLEDLIKVTNFHTLILSDCIFSPETMNEFLNMLEFYQYVCHIEVEMNFEEDNIWQSFCNACSNVAVLESMSFKKMNITESNMRCLMLCIKHNHNITILKFDSCMLVKLPNFYLIDSLMTNTTIRELYLPSTGLYTKEAEVLARFLINNTHLKVLDIGNNFIGDRGMDSLAKGLCKQNTPGVGLSALSVFNNQITEKSGQIISIIIMECKNLHTLNLGYNNLTDQVLIHISTGLLRTNSLEGLGLQCTLLTCKGIDALSEAIPHNKSLQKINLKGNKAIQLHGVDKLCNALTNSKITKVEIDENNRSCNDPEAYNQLVKKLFAICTVNKTLIETNDNEEIANLSQLISRKMSLSCEPRFTIPEPAISFQIGGSPRLSPIPSPVSSPAPKSRFQIVKVTDPYPIPCPKPKSRFLVTKVIASPDEEISIGRFANVRSSVSSNDSLDSLTTLHLDSDSE